QLYRKGSRTRLPLRGIVLGVLAVYYKVDVVPVRAGGGVSEADIPVVIARKFGKYCLFELLVVADISLFRPHLQLFGAVGKARVLLLREGGKSLQKIG